MYCYLGAGQSCLFRGSVHFPHIRGYITYVFVHTHTHNIHIYIYVYTLYPIHPSCLAEGSVEEHGVGLEPFRRVLYILIYMYIFKVSRKIDHWEGATRSLCGSFHQAYPQWSYTKYYGMVWWLDCFLFSLSYFKWNVFMMLCRRLHLDCHLHQVLSWWSGRWQLLFPHI